MIKINLAFIDSEENRIYMIQIMEVDGVQCDVFKLDEIDEDERLWPEFFHFAMTQLQNNVKMFRVRH